MSSPIFGLSIERVDAEPRPAIVSDMAVIGLVGTAPDAVAGTFPLNQPVLLNSDSPLVAALGSAGTLRGAIELAHAQLGEFQVSARIVVVRVAPGADDLATIANLAGSSSARTGVHALLEAGPALGVVPRLIAVPGFTGETVQGLGSLTLTGAGANLTAAPAVSFTGGGSASDKVMPTAHAVLGVVGSADKGKVVSLVIDSPGANLSGAVTVAFTGGGSASGKVLPTATGVVETTGNAVVAALPGVLEQLLGVAVISGPADSLQGFTDWRETFQSRRLIPLETGAKVGSPAVTVDAAPAVLGVAARRDHEKNGRPFHSWANQPVAGIVGPSRPIRFSLTDGATEGQQILALNGGIIVRGEAGVEAAIATGGFVLVATDTADEDELWRFYNVVRGRDYIHLAFLRTLRTYLGRFNITGHVVQAIINTMTSLLSDLQADGDILGFKVSFPADANSIDELRAGKITVDFAAEEAPVLRRINIRSARYRPAFEFLLADLLAAADEREAAAA